MSSQTDAASPVSERDVVRSRRRVLASGYLGSTVEYYDFLLYGTASAVVFNRLFFTDLDPVAGTIAAFGTFAAGYLARPVGGIVFGHFGDRYGRKRMLIVSLVVMGAGSTLIGLLPTQPMVGALAPVLLTLLRIVQGLSMAGEWGGATVMAIEHADSRRRGLANSIIAAGAPTGSLLASGAIAVFSMLPEEDFLSWGWRVPFLLSAVLLAIALWIRLRVEESPVFLQAKEKAAADGAPPPRVPLWDALRSWRPLVLSVLAGIGPHAYRTLTHTFLISQAILHGAPAAEVLWAAAAASAVNLITITPFGRLTDLIGRKAMMYGGFALAALTAWPVLMLATSGSTLLVFASFLISGVFGTSVLLAALGALVSEQFPTTMRYTAASVGYQVASSVGAGLSPLVAASIVLAADGDLLPVAGVMVGALVVSAVAVSLLRETYRRSLAEDD